MADPRDVEPIAIIGMGCRLPGNVGNAEDLWRLVSSGGSGWKMVPADRWTREAFYHPDKAAMQSYNTTSGYFMDQDISHYDSRFFGFSSAEANLTDPQQRILLETTYEALENAGIPMESLKGSDTAVFAALFARDYDRMGYKDLNTLSGRHIGGAGEAIIANRISHFFDLRGTSMTIDTGCSGSLVALNEACLCLRTDQSRMAIVGGTEILLHPDQNISMSTAGMLNDDGKCYTFDSRGSGYGRGEGVATVVVKRLRDALEDGDNVHAVIRVSGSNQDGKTNGITLPSAEAQETLMRQVYRNVGLDPQETLYVEAHGTGTVAGDNAEAKSLSAVFCEKPRPHNLWVGSVKTNMGHLEATSGLAGLIKAVMVLQKQQIPPNLNYITPKPGLMLDERQLEVPLELLPLIPEGEEGAVRVSLNSFGYGGTNCHVILESLEQYKKTGSRYLLTNGVNNHKANGVNGTNGVKHVNGINHTIGTNGANGVNGHHATDLNGVNGHEAGATNGVSSPEQLPLVFPLSASSEVTLEAMPAAISKWLAAGKKSESDLRQLSYTLSCRRSLLKWRKAFVASDVEQLQGMLDEPKVSKTRAAPAAKIAFVFTGQGAQWARMGCDLVASSEVFRRSVEASSRVLRSLGCEWDLLEELSKSGGDSRINESELAQPLTTIVQLAIVDLLASLDIKPQFVVGHSSGEIAAAYAAGALSHDDAIRGSFFRGRYSKVAKKLNPMPGSMLATGYSEQAALQTIKTANLGEDKGRVVVACVNSPNSVTLSGDEPAIDSLKDMLYKVGIFARKLVVESAYHSHHMEKVADAYAQSISDIEASDVNEDVEFLSSVTGAAKTTGFGSEYWVKNLVSQVKFNDAVNALAQRMTETSPLDAANIFIEIGPHSALQGPLKQILSAIPSFKHSYVAPLARGKSSSETFQAAAARLFELGAEQKWQSLFSSQDKQVVGDLLPYPWDHRVQHWSESRLSRDHRLRQFPYHDLLGLFDVMSPIDEPRWRFFVSVEHMPWLKDHVVDGMVIFPGAGYSAMGIEAMKQLTQMQNPGAKISRIISRNIRNFRPIVLPEETTDGANNDIEVQLVLSPSKMNDNAPWYSVRVLSLQPDGTWADHVSGTIRVELDSDRASGFGEEQQAALEEAHEALERVQALAQEKMDMSTFYDERRAAGNDWGPSFALLTEGYIGKGCGLAKMRIPDMSQWMPFGHFEPHLIHPTTLDASNHMLPAIFHREVINSPLMPFTTDESVFTSHLSSKPGDEMIVATELKPEGKTAARCNAWAFQPDESGNLRMVSSVRGLVLRSVGEDLNKMKVKPFERKHNYQVFWKDDPDFLTQAGYDRLVGPLISRGPEVIERLITDETAAAIYLNNVKDLPVVRDPDTAAMPHLAKYARWISDFVHADTCHDMIASLDSEDQKTILERSAASGIEGEGLSCIGSNLEAILNNEISPLELLVADNILERIYADGPANPLINQMVEYISLLTNKDPQMDILEVGAGTGSATVPFFTSLGDDGFDKIHKYHYTDISTSFFDTAREKLEKWSGVLEYKTLDISKDPVEQGFDPAQQLYDVIIASNVLHATRSIHDTLTHVRKLLKPGGRLLLIEMERVETRILPAIFGTLSGWWEFDDHRKDSALLTNDEWNEELLAASFGGIEYVSPNCEKSRISLIVAKAVQEKPADPSFTPPTSVRIISNSASAVGRLAGKALSSAFEEKSMASSAITWESLPTFDQENTSTLHVVLDSANSSVLANPDADMFARVQSVLINSRHILWIMFHEEDQPDLMPIKALINGLGRTLRREAEVIKLVTVEIKDLITQKEVGALVHDIAHVSDLLLTSEREPLATDDEEFTIENGRVLIPRAYADKQFNDWTDRVNGRSALVPCAFTDPELPLRMEVGAPGLLSSIHFVKDEAAFTPLGPEEIRIDSKAFGVNFRDVFTALGQMGSSSLYMGECAGVVTKVGSGDFVQKTYKIGDRVMGIFASPFASQGTMSGYDCHVLPDNLSFTEAASILIIYSTVYYSFVNISRLEPGQSVLIHAGSGGVGQAAIQLVRHLGCTDDDIFVTVGSEEKKQFLIDEYGILESHILSSRSAPMDLKRKIMRMTNERGVDVVLNSTSGEMLSESWECVAPFGFHIELGKADIERKRHISMGPFSRTVTFSSLDMTIVSKQRPKVFYDVLDKTMALFAQGILKPVRPLNVFPVDRLEASFRLISERKHLGKVVLDLGDETTKVQTILPPPPALQLKRDGAYIIAGGLGDIGRMLVKYLTKLGAGHVVTLSRRQLPDDERVAFEEEVKSLGGQLHLAQCDITSKESVEKLAEDLRNTLPAIRGIVHAGMVLKDRPFIKMNSEEWNTVLGPKVFGTWHLNSAFKSPDLDFFITLSSISGAVGNPGQSNYGAANAFQDAFVASQAGSKGTRYVSLDLPIVGETKAVTNLQSQNHDFQHKGGIVFNIDEIPQLMEYAMDSSVDLGRPYWHALMGFDRQSIAMGSGDYIWTAVFRTIPQLQASDSAEFGQVGAKRDVEALLRAAQSLDEAVQIIAEVTHEKFIAFLNLDSEDVSMNQPLSAFGLDSLVSIELKNWMVRTFKVSLQAAELSNAPSIIHLAETLASRSKILPANLAKTSQVAGLSEEPTQAEGAFQDTAVVEQQLTNGTHDVLEGLECCPVPTEDAVQHVPDLVDSMQTLLENFADLAEDEDEVQNLRTALAELTAPGSVGERVYLRIKEQASDIKNGNWIQNYLRNDSYLPMRQPLQYTAFMGFNHPTTPAHSQAERAALMIMECVKFKRDIDEDKVGIVLLADTPICKSQLAYMFNTYRRPGVGKDELVKTPGDYCVVLRRGRLFVLPLIDPDFNSIRGSIATILSHVTGEDSWAGILTSDHRDSWAERRQELLALTPANALYLQSIEGAAFVVNLDQGSPVGYTNHAKAGMLNDGFNRWFDKCLQIVVTENGNSGVIGEHSHIDGTTPGPLYDRMHKAIFAYKPTALASEGELPHELSLTTSADIESHMLVLRERFREASSVRDYTSHILPTFTGYLLGNNGVSVKSGFDLLVQLSLYFYYDRRITPNWQPIMNLHFHQGRHDVLQMMSASVRAFCEGAVSNQLDNSQKRRLLIEAAKDISLRTRTVRAGNGFFRLITVMQHYWPEDEEPASVFEDALYHKGFNFAAMSNINHPTSEAITTPLDANSLRLRYTLQDHQTIVSLNCPVGSTEKFVRCVDEAAAIITELALAR